MKRILMTIMVLLLLSLWGCGEADRQVTTEQEVMAELHTCRHCENAQAWGDDTMEENKLPLEDGHYYLVKDVILSGTDQAALSGKNITICLNGKTINGAGLNNGFGIFRLLDGTNLTIADCSANTGVIIPNSAANGGVADLSFGTKPADTCMTVCDVVVDGQSAAIGSGGGAFFLNDGAAMLTLNNVDIKNCGADRGGAIFAYHGKINLNDVDISSCVAAKEGGAIFLEKAAEVNMNGGSITGSLSAGNKRGTAVYIGAGCSLSMSGGEITESKGSPPAVCVWGAFHVSGDAKIHNNNSKDYEVWFGTDSTGTISGGEFTPKNVGVLFVQEGGTMTRITITGGTFNGHLRAKGTKEVKDEQLTIVGGVFTEAAGIVNHPYIIGGNFAKNPTSKLPDGYVWYEQTGNVGLKDHEHNYDSGLCDLCGEADPTATAE